jgi:hypothetical protein
MLTSVTQPDRTRLSDAFRSLNGATTMHRNCAWRAASACGLHRVPGAPRFLADNRPILGERSYAFAVQSIGKALVWVNLRRPRNDTQNLLRRR